MPYLIPASGHGRAPMKFSLVMIAALVLAGSGCANDDGDRASETTSYTMPSEAMEPTIKRGSAVEAELVDSYDGRRGDVVVFTDPGGWLTALDDGALIKRVIGVGGDTIECCDGQGRLAVNGAPLDEEYVAPSELCNGPMTNGCAQPWSADVPGGNLFVMGDNRQNSSDSSRYLACPRNSSDCTTPFVPEGVVVGVVQP